MEENKPVKKTTAKKTTAKKTSAPKPAAKTKVEPKVEQKPDKIAIFSSGRLFHPTLGRLAYGYNVVDFDVAQEWMKVSEKVREATPQEVASAYGV
jgi:hypothetical protein